MEWKIGMMAVLKAAMLLPAARFADKDQDSLFVPRLDVDHLPEHRKRDLGLMDGRAPRGEPRQRGSGLYPVGGRRQTAKPPPR